MTSLQLHERGIDLDLIGVHYSCAGGAMTLNCMVSRTPQSKGLVVGCPLPIGGTIVYPQSDHTLTKLCSDQNEHTVAAHSHCTNRRVFTTL